MHEFFSMMTVNTGLLYILTETVYSTRGSTYSFSLPPKVLCVNPCTLSEATMTSRWYTELEVSSLKPLGLSCHDQDDTSAFKREEVQTEMKPTAWLFYHQALTHKTHKEQGFNLRPVCMNEQSRKFFLCRAMIPAFFKRPAHNAVKLFA